MLPVAVLLAGGPARRMGGGDKSLRLLGGRALLSHAVDRIRPQVGALVLNANGDAARFAAWGLPVVADAATAQGPQGPLAGILAGMTWAAEHHPACPDLVSVPTDTPFLPRDLVSRLLEARDREKADIALAAHGAQVHFATALWPLRLAADLQATLDGEGTRKVESFARRYKIAVVQFGGDGDADPFFNINRPEDLAAAESRLTR